MAGGTPQYFGEVDDQQISSNVEQLRAEVNDLRERVRALEENRVVEQASKPKATGIGFGLTAVNRIGAVTLAIGIIFFFKYAVDSEWIGPRIRVVLGITAGLALIAAAERLRRRGQMVFSQGIAGCGLATLYITCYAAFAWYQWFSHAAAAISLIGVSALAVALSLRDGHNAIAALGFTGGILTPLLLRAAESDSALTLFYLLAIDLTCVLLASGRQWPALTALIGAEAIVTGFFLTTTQHEDWFVVFALALAAERFFAAAAAGHTQDFRNATYLTAHCFVVLGVLREVILWTERSVAQAARSGAESEFGSLFIALYGVAALAFGILRPSRPALGFGLALTGAVIVKLYLWDVWFLERLYRMSAFGLLGILLLTASWIYSRAKDAG